MYSNSFRSIFRSKLAIDLKLLTMKKVKKKLKPSWEMYSRILWDPKLHQQAFHIGFVDRMATEGLREKLLVDWEGSDIPWNRVQYIRCGNSIVWDRNKRIDLFENDQLPLEAYNANASTNAPIQIQGVNIVPKPTFAWAADHWKTINTIPTVNSAQLKIATFNCLTNKYEKEVIQSHLRFSAIVKELEQLDADIILLQEVDAPLLALLLKLAAIRGWYSSDTKRTAQNYYQELLILAKYPFSVVEYQHSEQKKFPIGSWSINGEQLHIANVHLTSNRSKEALKVRAAQLNGILTYLDNLEGAVFIAGDFNSRGKEGLAILDQQGFKDGWESLNSTLDGYTFEPSHNPLAQHLSLTGLPARFDRICLKADSWQPTTVELFGNQAINTEGLFASDHYGVLLSLGYQEVEKSAISSKWGKTAATYRSGIVIIPPKEIWETIQAIRQQHDSKYQRWMPHITLLYGFLPDRYFAEAMEELSTLAKDFEAFDINLNQYQLFSQQSSVTAWLEPICSKVGILQDLQEALQRLFPMANSQLKKLPKFRPHLSIGQFESELQAKELLPIWESLKFGVTQLAVISRQQDQPFELRYTVDLGSGKVSNINNNRILEQELMQLVCPSTELDQNQQERKNFALELVQEVCTAVLGYPISLETLGSARLGTTDMTSDIDLICCIPNTVNIASFLTEVLAQLDGYYQQARLVVDAQVPILKLTIEGIKIDLLAAQHPNFPTSLNNLKESDRYDFEATSWQALSGILEVDNLLKQVKPHCSLDTFRWLVKTIKTWATARGIKANALGYLGSYSWTVLAAWTCQQVPVQEDKESLVLLLDYFFRLLAQHNWDNPISLNSSTDDYKLRPKQDRMPILTTVQPYYNSARNITKSTAYWLQQELEKGATVLTKIRQGKATWNLLFNTKITTLANKLILNIEGETEEELLAYCGWVEGHLVGLLIALEQKCQALVRPSSLIKIDDLNAQLNIGLKLAGFANDQVHLKQCLQEFTREFDQALQNWNPMALQWSLL